MSRAGVPAGAVEVVAERLRQAGLKSDVPAPRVIRAVRDVMAARGADAEAVLVRPLVDEVVERLAIHESWFFRDPKQLAALRSAVLPALSPPVRAWCVGCANGQEPWSVAMLLAEAYGPGGDWRVLATDLSERAVAAAERGVYRAPQLRGLSAQRRARFFVREPGEEEAWRVADGLRGHVEFRRHNVVTERPPPDPASCDIVCIRNVLIYLHDDGVQAALSALRRAMRPEGWLLLGTAESLWGRSDQFTVERLPGAFAYRPTEAAEAVATRPAAGPRARVSVGAGRAGGSTAVDLLAAGRDAAAASDFEAGARLFRQAAYLEPDLREAHEGLAAALAAVGDERGARRARAAAARLLRKARVR